MSPKSLAAIAGFAVLPVIGVMSDAAAQTRSPVQDGGSYSLPRSRTRIEVNPRPLLYRRCVDRYVLQYRPSGTVLFPEQHCWWVR